MCNAAYHFKVNCIVDEFFKRVYTFYRINYASTRREGAILQSPCPSVRPSICLSVHTFVTDISASTGRNDFIFDIWLWHGDLYRVSPFQVYCTSTSCLPCDLQMNEWGYSQHDVACNILLFLNCISQFIVQIHFQVKNEN